MTKNDIILATVRPMAQASVAALLLSHSDKMLQMAPEEELFEAECEDNMSRDVQVTHAGDWAVQVFRKAREHYIQYLIDVWHNQFPEDTTLVSFWTPFNTHSDEW